MLALSYTRCSSPPNTQGKDATELKEVLGETRDPEKLVQRLRANRTYFPCAGLNESDQSAEEEEGQHRAGRREGDGRSPQKTLGKLVGTAQNKVG